MSVSLTPPNALGFNRPLTVLVKRSLTISNHNAQPVAFKVKTTAPKTYTVRPNSGRVEPGESVDVSVMLQPMKEEPPLSTKCKDKFLIQSTIITPEKEALSLQEIWNVAGDGEESKVHSQKLKVNFLPPEGQTVEEEDEPVEQDANFRPSNLNHFGTVREVPQGPSRALHFDADPTERARSPTPPAADFIHAHEEDRVEDVHYPEPPAALVTQQSSGSSAPPVAEEHPIPIPPPASVPAPEPVPEVAPAPVDEREVDEELLAKYIASQKEIERLRALLAAIPEPAPTSPVTEMVESEAEPELRRRRRPLSEYEDESTVYRAESDVGTSYSDRRYASQPEGVPLQVVVGIAFGVFLMTYMFF